MEQELQEETRKNIESKQQLKRADGFVRKLGQIIHNYRRKDNISGEQRHKEKSKDIPALEYLSNEVNKLLHSHAVTRRKSVLQRCRSEERAFSCASVSLASNEANDSISSFRRASDYEQLPPSKEEEKTDEESSRCECCHKEFTWYRWKHHCRMCGKLVCEGCSPYKEYVVGYSDSKVRVCRECYCTKRKGRNGSSES